MKALAHISDQDLFLELRRRHGAFILATLDLSQSGRAPAEAQCSIHSFANKREALFMGCQMARFTVEKCRNEGMSEDDIDAGIAAAADGDDQDLADPDEATWSGKWATMFDVAI